MWRTTVSKSGPLFVGLSTAVTCGFVLSSKSSKIASEQASYGVNTPGLYLWGTNQSKLISNEDVSFVRQPTRVGYFDGKLLRDLCIDEKLAVAILENGDVVHWTRDKQPSVVVKGKNISKAKVSNGLVYGLSGNTVYTWDVDGNLNKLEGPKLGWFESFKDIQAGKEHLLVLSSSGRVYTASTGMIQPDESKGQYGIASMSQFDKPPKPGKLHEIPLLNELGGTIDQIAAGDYHSMVRTTNGKVHGFGENMYGQVGIPFSYRSSKVGVPTAVKFEQLYTAFAKPNVSRVVAGSSVSYITVDSVSNDGDKEVNNYAFGNGLTGHLGTGKWVHAQSTPQLMKALKLTEYSESLQKVIPIGINEWSVGASHSVVTLKNQGGAAAAAEYGEDVMVWGGNECYQLGTGKKSNQAAPITILPLDVDRDDEESTEAGLRMQLFKNKSLKYSANGISRSVTCDQMIYAGHHCTAVYYRKSA